MSTSSFTKKRVTIMGLGRYPHGSSISAAEFMQAAGAFVTVVDDKPLAELAAFPMWKKRLPRLTYKLGAFEENDVTSADIIIRNPAILPSHPLLLKARRKGIPIHTDISLFFHLRRRIDVGITGTRGKSTTSALVATILKQHFPLVSLGGNMSISPLSFLNRLQKNSKVVLELSSYLCESLTSVRQSPHIACITNLYPDHLNVHKNFRDYREAKANIFRFQTKRDVCVLNADDPLCIALSRRVPSRVVWFSLHHSHRDHVVFASDGKIISKEGVKQTTILPLKEIHLLGAHNIANVCAAVAIARSLGLPLSAIRSGIRKFRGLPHRLEYLGKKNTFEFYNDSSSTIPEAAVRAVEAIGHPVILLAGGNDKNLRYTGLGGLARGHIQRVFLLPGTATKKMQTRFRELHVPTTSTTGLRDAFERAVTECSSGTILLSPAASSFAEFANEFERGDAFRTLVKSYGT